MWAWLAQVCSLYEAGRGEHMNVGLVSSGVQYRTGDNKPVTVGLLHPNMELTSVGTAELQSQPVPTQLCLLSSVGALQVTV
jgi:hypothetical protein